MRRFGSQYRFRPSRTRESARRTRPTTTSAIRTTSAAPAGRCGCRRRTPGTPSTAQRSGRSRAGSGSTGTSRTPRRWSLRPRGWAGEHWSPAIGAEHRATRGTAAIFDESSFAKLEIEGPAAAELLERLCDNRVAREVGKLTYTQMLNRRGGIECDFTVARLGPELFSIVTGTAFGNHDREWIRKHFPRTAAPRCATSRPPGRASGSGAAGPRRARADAAGPLERGLPLHVRARDHDRQRPGARAARHLRRRARLGDLLPDGVRARPLADALGGGGDHGLVAGGYRAIDSLRLEKGYRAWGADITPDETPYEGASASA